MRTATLSCLIFAWGGCAVLESDDNAPAPPSPERDVSTAESERETGRGIAGVAADARDKAAAAAAVSATCFDGEVEGPGGCERCVQDDHCPTGPCNAETGRCPTVGWCTAEGADPACPASQRCDGGQCVASSKRVGACGLEDVHFGWDSTVVPAAARIRLESAAECIGTLDRVYIEAHTDEVGSEEFNILLSERRGLAVRDVLIAAGVERARLQVIAKGSLEATGKTHETRALDRRVALITP
ncbi:MAG: OmpA family protein [Myxococcota bacterium]